MFIYIQTKLPGNARVVVHIQNCSSWGNLQKAFSNFNDQRDQYGLIHNLVPPKQTNKSPSHYFPRCISLLKLLCSCVSTHEMLATTEGTKHDLFNRLTLKTSLAVPLDRSIRAQNNAESIRYIQNHDNSNQNRTLIKPRFVRNRNADKMFLLQIQTSLHVRPLQCRMWNVLIE